MCFSATASFAASGVLSLVGIASVYKARNSKLILFAATPLLFAAQQFTEGMLWRWFDSGHNAITNSTIVYFFIFFAFLFWPVWIPLSTAYAEPHVPKKRILYGLFAVGASLALYLLIHLLKINTIASFNGCHISYDIGLHGSYYTPLSLFYCTAVLLPLFVSSIKKIWILGVAISGAYVITYVFYTMFFSSVWCFLAACLSSIILWIVHANSSLVSSKE